MTNKRTRVTQGIALLSLLSVLSGTASATTAPSGWHLSAGTAINFREIELHVKGKPLSVYEIVYSLHPMNDPGYSLPIGLWIYNFIEVGQTGHADNCKKWFNQVAHDESGTHEVPYPYLEFDTLTGYTPIVTDEGTLVIPDGSVSCWEAMDFRLPV
jgi:hypothetical protein